MHDLLTEVFHHLDVGFFFGRGSHANPQDDEVTFDVNDSYETLPLKVKAALAWSLEHGYEYSFKIDDDTYLVPERLHASNYHLHDYIGRYRNPHGRFPAGYACGGTGYWISAKAARIVVDAPWNGDWAEDGFVGNVLLRHGIRCQNDERYCFVPHASLQLHYGGCCMR